jgi:hypothetical protein
MGYEESPWVFKGRCGSWVASRHVRQLYEVALSFGQIPDEGMSVDLQGFVPASTRQSVRGQWCFTKNWVQGGGMGVHMFESILQARKYIPDSLKIVNFLGCAILLLYQVVDVFMGGCMLLLTVFTRLSLSCRYTLGGFYLARYTDSPVGAFDEVGAAAVCHCCHQQRCCMSRSHCDACFVWKQLVAVAGLVWNFPGSCAWAARVYVNDKCVACVRICVGSLDAC